MTYKDLVKENVSKFKGDEKVMWASIGKVSDLLEQIKETHPKIYWNFMREQHETMFGKHFNEPYAKWQVKQMHHRGDDGKNYSGEHWSIEATNSVLSKYRSKIPSAYNEWDFYVALNAQYHDYCAWARRQFTDDYETAIIEMALAFWFADEDWIGHTKVWDYFSILNAMSE